MMYFVFASQWNAWGGGWSGSGHHAPFGTAMGSTLPRGARHGPNGAHMRDPPANPNFRDKKLQESASFPGLPELDFITMPILPFWVPGVGERVFRCWLQQRGTGDHVIRSGRHELPRGCEYRAERSSQAQIWSFALVVHFEEQEATPSKPLLHSLDCIFNNWRVFSVVWPNLHLPPQTSKRVGGREAVDREPCGTWAWF